MTNTSIAVVIPLYNHARYIGLAIESVLLQTSPADEIVVIDDGSGDAGLMVAETALSGVVRARCYRQPNVGAHTTINRLIEATQSDFIAILNSDDRFVFDKLERCRKLLTNQPDIGLLCGRIGPIDETCKPILHGATVDWLKRAEIFYTETGLAQISLLNENFVCTTSNMVFSRKMWQACGGFANLRYCHDLDFLMTAFVHGRVHIDNVAEHILYRVHGTNTIGEDIGRIRVEIAAVIAAAFMGSGGRRLLEGHPSLKGLQGFMQVLENKAMTGLICYLMTLSQDFPDRFAFYDYVATPALSDMLRSFVG